MQISIAFCIFQQFTENWKKHEEKMTILEKIKDGVDLSS